MAIDPRSSREPLLDRSREVERMRGVLERDGYPRLRMALLVTLSGGCGFLASFALLTLGLTSIAWRYPIALCVAYAVFLFALRAWIRSRADHSFDMPDLDRFGDPSPLADTATNDAVAADVPRDRGTSRGPNASSTGDFSFDGGDEVGAVLWVVVLVAVVTCASLWVIYAAPALFAELIFDGVIAAGLYRRVRHSDTRHWLDTAIRRTWVPFALTLVALVAFGLAAAKLRPDAHSIGRLMHPAASVTAEP